MNKRMNLRRVVVNTCFGGFGLSNEAFELFLTKKGIKFYKEVRFPNLIESFDYYQGAPNGEDKNLLSYYDEDLVKRDDPILVEVVRELGEKANGYASDLKIIEIPADIGWIIDEYDGRESIHESHNSWN